MVSPFVFVADLGFIALVSERREAERVCWKSGVVMLAALSMSVMVPSIYVMSNSPVRVKPPSLAGIEHFLWRALLIVFGRPLMAVLYSVRCCLQVLPL